jgi:hypothetical protein
MTMKVIALMTLILAACIIAGNIRVAADATHATVSVEKFDPPAVLDNYNDLIEVVTVTNLPGAPGLVLHIPCLRSKMSQENQMGWAGRIVAPGVVEGCNPQKIPSGSAAGQLVREDGEILPPPRPQ